MTAIYPPIKTGEPHAILAGIWRKILQDLDIDPTRLDGLVEQYSRRMTHVSPQKRTSWYGNVSPDLIEPSITWMTFLRGPRVLGAKKMTLEFVLKHRFVRTRHTLIIEYGPPDQPEEILTDKGEKPPTELSLFFTRIMFDLGVSPSTFNNLLTCYMRRTLRVESTPSNRSFLRGNYRKEFINPRLSWISFIKGLDFLTIPEFDLYITIETGGRRGKTTHHHERIVLNEISDMLADMSEDEFLEPPEELVIHEPAATDATSGAGNQDHPG